MMHLSNDARTFAALALILMIIAAGGSFIRRYLINKEERKAENQPHEKIRIKGISIWGPKP